MLKTLIIVAILTVASATVFGQKVKSRHKPRPKIASGDCYPEGNRPFNGAVLNMRAVSLPKPEYPGAARAVRAEGSVAVRVQVDEAGNVVDACALSGNRLLRPAALSAARNAKIKPVLLSGTAVKTSGLLVYNFTAPPK